MRMNKFLNIDNFKFVFYASFRLRRRCDRTRPMRRTKAYCLKKGRKNFEYHVRISSILPNGERWNEQFIDKALETYSDKKISKIWVCGPPLMNEEFDSASLTKIAPKY